MILDEKVATSKILDFILSITFYYIYNVCIHPSSYEKR